MKDKMDNGELVLYKKGGGYVYVLYSHKDGKRYTGLTKNLRQRLQMHNEGKVKSTKSRRPLELVYYEWYKEYSLAVQRERYLKSYYGKKYLKKRVPVSINQPAD